MKAIVTLTVIALFAAIAASGEIITKGGASGLMKAPAVWPGTPAPAMKCAACKSEFVIIKAPTFKGTVPVTSILERHACKSCGTKWTTTGHGKAKVEVALHTCAGCAK